MSSNSIAIFHTDHRPDGPHLIGPLMQVSGYDVATADDGPTFGEVAERYFREVTEVWRTPSGIENAKSLLKVHIYPAWKDTPLRSIKKHDVKKLLHKIGTTRARPYGDRQDGCQGRANTTLKFLRQFFIWCTDDEYGENLIQVNPCYRLKLPFPYRPRERVLSDDEIRILWLATGLEGFPHGTITRLLLLTAQRRSEIANALKTQIDRTAGLLTIPIHADKSRRGHLVPLSDLALELFNSAPRFPGCPLVFTYNGINVPKDFWRYGRRLRRRMIELRRADIVEAGGDPDSADIAPFTFHDLRRTAATMMCRLGHSLEVVDKILNHQNGKTGSGRTVSSTARVYCKYELLDERGAALQALGNYIKTLVGA